MKLYDFPFSPNCRKVRAVAYELGISLEQRFQARRVLTPQGMPQGERLFRRLVLTLARGLRLAGVTARELGVQEYHRLAHDFRDACTLAWGEISFGQALQLAEDSLVVPGNVGKRHRAQPRGAPVGVGKGKVLRAGLRLRRRLGESEFVGH